MHTYIGTCLLNVNSRRFWHVSESWHENREFGFFSCEHNFLWQWVNTNGAYREPRSPLGPTAWNGLVSVSLNIPPPPMLGWLCGCGLCGPKRKLAGGNLKAVAWPKRNCDWLGSKWKLRVGGGPSGPSGPNGTGDGWWCVGGGDEFGDGGDVPPNDMSESSLSLPPGPGLNARRGTPFPGPDCCCILQHSNKCSYCKWCLKLCVHGMNASILKKL